MKFIGFVAFMIVWCSFCALQDYVLKIEEDTWIMLYGFFAGLFSSVACKGLSN